jgi:transglutaminase-like putative cysteine protease
MDIRRGSLCLIALCFIAGQIMAAEKATPRKLRFTITIENPTTRTLSGQRVLLYMPVKQTGVQRLVDLEVDVPHELTTDAVGNSILELQFAQFPAYATRVVSVSAVLEMRPSRESRRQSKSELYLGAEPFIETDLPAVQQLAARLKGARPADTSRAIYDWVVGNLHYAGFVPQDLGAAYALRERRGDCTEYAYLAAALARASGMPARVLGGYVTSTDAAPRSADYHNWAEFYFDGAWHLVDAQKESYLDHSLDYVAMRVISKAGSDLLGGHHRFRVAGELVARME